MLFITQESEIQIDIPVQVLYFYASWMPFHNKFVKMIDRIEGIRKNIPFFAIDVGQFDSQCKRFSIKSVPTLLILKGGKEIKRIEGLILTEASDRVFADICDQ